MKESGSFFGRQNLIASDARLAHKDAVTPAALGFVRLTRYAASLGVNE